MKHKGFDDFLISQPVDHVRPSCILLAARSCQLQPPLSTSNWIRKMHCSTGCCYIEIFIFVLVVWLARQLAWNQYHLAISWQGFHHHGGQHKATASKGEAVWSAQPRLMSTKQRKFNHYKLSLAPTSYMEPLLACLRHPTWAERNVKKYRTKEKEQRKYMVS